MFKKIASFYHSQDPLLFWSFSLTLLLAIACVSTILLNVSSLPPQLPLYYSLPWGEKQLVSLSQFLILPAMIVILTLINLIISWHLHSSQFVVKRLLSICTMIVALLITITAFKIINIFV